MFNDIRVGRGSVRGSVLGITVLTAILFVAGCGSPATPTAVLTITKTHTGSFSQGQQGATYTVTVSNTGKVATSGTVTVTDTIPSGETLVSMAGTGWTCAAGANTCTRADALSAATSYPTITVTVNVSASATSPQVNQVSVAGGGAANASGQDSTTVIGTPAKLAITVQPSVVAAGASITPAVAVTVEDSNGNPVPAATNQVTIAIGTNPSGGTLGGTAQVNATAGVATFTGLNINNAGVGYTLTASATGLTGATSSAFNVFGGATKLSFTVQPSNVGAGGAITPAVQVSVEDANGSLVATATNSITIAIGTNPSTGVLTGTLIASAANGVATFSNLSINLTANGYTLAASSSGLTQATSNTFNVTNADPCTGAGTGSESLLNGSYAFTQTGFDNGSTPEPALIGGVLTFNGTGTISSGALDMNLNAGAQTNLAVTAGTYKVGSDHRACMGVTTSAGTLHYRLSLAGISNNVASTGHMINIDTAGPFTTGTMVKQSSTIPTSFSGNYAFGISSPQNTANTNNSISGGKFAAAGVINFTSGTTFTQTLDFSQNGQLNGNPSNTLWSSTTPLSVSGGTYAIAANGRGTFTFTPPGSPSSVNAVMYVVSTTEAFLLDVDAQNANSAFAGIALQQSGSFSASSLSGTSVFYQSSLQNNGSSPSTSDVQIGTITTTGASISFSAWEVNPANTSTPVSLQTGSGTVAVAANGRVTFPTGVGNHPPVFWLVNTNEAFFLGGSTSVESGMIEPQSTLSVSTTAPYAFGSTHPQVPLVVDESGVATFASTTVSGTSDNALAGTLALGNTFTTSFTSETSSVAGTIGPSGCTVGNTGATGCLFVYYVISPTQVVLLPLQNPQANAVNPTPVVEIGNQ